jgi:hypothetical protein
MGSAAVHVIAKAGHAASVVLSGFASSASSARQNRRLSSRAGWAFRANWSATISLRQLERDGLVETVGERRKRNCTGRLVRAVARSYVISPSALGPLAAHPDTVSDRASSTYLIAVAARLIADVSKQHAGAARAGKRLATMTLTPNAA